MKKILIRVNSSSQIGIGHLMRCLTLAKQYENSQIIFASEALKGNLNEKIVQEGYSLEILKDNDSKRLIKLIKKLDIDLLIIDHYGIDYGYEKKIKEKTAVKILSFDDLYEKHCCDFLLNHNVYASKKKYKKLVPKGCEIRCGQKYTLIRDEFKKVKAKRKKRKSIFVSIGGTDHLGINIDILKVLTKAKKNYKIDIVTTTANKNLKKLKAYCKGKAHITLHINSKKLAKLMNQSSFAIVTPSVVIHEVMFMKLPFVAIQTANNQKLMSAYLQKKKRPVLKSFSSKRLYKVLKEIT